MYPFIHTIRKQEEESLHLALELSKKDTSQEDEGQEEEDTSNPQEEDLLGMYMSIGVHVCNHIYTYMYIHVHVCVFVYLNRSW